jgi:hypothetical protein
MYCNIPIYFCLGTILDNVILLKILYNIILLEAWRLKVIYDFLFNNLGTLNCVLLNLHWHFYQVYRTCVNNARELKWTLSLSLSLFFLLIIGVSPPLVRLIPCRELAKQPIVTTSHLNHEFYTMENRTRDRAPHHTVPCLPLPLVTGLWICLKGGHMIALCIHGFFFKFFLLN